MSELRERVARLNDVLCAVNLLTWDSRVIMPPGGAETRGRQIATLKGVAREMILEAGMRRACEAALRATEALPPDDPERREAEAVAAAIAHHERVPAALLQRQAELGPVAQAAWAEARARADFALFRPWLERVVDNARALADALGYDGHPYEALVDLYEPGETAASLSRLFGRLREGVRPILDAALARPQPRDDFLSRDYPEADQRAVAEAFARRLGYDFMRGRLDVSVHPFEVSFTREDVRITTRYRRDWLPGALFGAIHETGHALYEQGVDPAFTRTAHATDLRLFYAVGGTSFGAHESQSRLWENHVGRSPAFWTHNFALLRERFPEPLADVAPEAFAAAVNRPAPGFIRVEADELTYDLHIMLRVEIETALMDGSLKAAEVPEAWNAAVRRDLGLDVPDDARGCLQDVHWSSGYVGSFPTYTVGNVMAAQIMAHLREREPGVIEAAEAAGDYAPLAGRLREAVWRHGRSRSRDEILAALTGRPLSPEPYLAHLAARFADAARAAAQAAPSSLDGPRCARVRSA